MSLPYRLGGKGIFDRPNENSLRPKRIVFLSVEGTKTEVKYFQYIERFREQLGIEAIVHIEVLRRNDTKSDPNSVLALLEEYIHFRESNTFITELSKLELRNYDISFIKTYLENPDSISKRNRNKFEAVLKNERLDLCYLDFLSKYQGENDAFGIVLDRDCGSHSVKQMNDIIKKCREKQYHCFITNPCLEFWQLLHVSNVAEEYKDQLNDILANRLDPQGNSFVSNLLYSKTNQRKALPLKTFQTYYLPNVDLAIERAQAFAPNSDLIHELGSDLWKLFDLLRMNDL
ncbi:RloB family protein [Megasphaera stantonii]|uniref:RloB family protein n=1 Tax=Megasphaera stantonii TaxID=2144175 RepID=UPI00195D6CF1|nr:RloB family protein [Megasphaera stantonii]MBM6733535.1 RloB domain-containing protein [Megasphaera stantonii]